MTQQATPSPLDNPIPELVQSLQQVVELQMHPLLDRLDAASVGWSKESSEKLNGAIASFMTELRHLAEWQSMERDENGQWYKP